MLEIATLALLIPSLLFFAIKREIIYLLVTITLFLASLPLKLEFEVFVEKPPTTILHLDYSESSKDKIKKIEPLLSSLSFDFVRKFGTPHNTPEDLEFTKNEDCIHIIVSDFLFDLPQSLKESSNVILLYIGEKSKTNHFVKSVFLTNIGQIEYLCVENISPSPVHLSDPKTKKQYYLGKPKDIHLVPTSSLPEEITISSGKTNFSFRLASTREIGIVWFEPNQDLRVMVNVLKRMGHNYSLFARVQENYNFENIGKFKYLIVGYPERLNLDSLANLSERGGKIVVIGSSENFLKDIFSTSRMRKTSLSTEDFYYNQSARIFTLNYPYPVSVENAIRCNFPKISGEFFHLDRYGITSYLKALDREFIFVNIRDIHRVDVENLKVGIYSSFAFDLFFELVRFLSETTSLNTDKLVLQESAIDGAVKPEGMLTIHVTEFSESVLKKMKKEFSKAALEPVRVDISTFWMLMVCVIFALGVRWLIR